MTKDKKTTYTVKIFLLYIIIIFCHINNNIYGDDGAEVIQTYGGYGDDNEDDCDKVYDPFEFVNRRI